MKWIGRWGLTVTVLVLALAPGPSSAATPSVRVSVDRPVVRSGEQLRVTARADTDCAWAISWQDRRVTGRGLSLAGSFTAPQVRTATRVPVVARCFPSEAATPAPRAGAGRPVGSSPSQRVRVGVPVPLVATVVVTVLPPRGTVLPPEGELPSTGGPSGGSWCSDCACWLPGW